MYGIYYIVNVIYYIWYIICIVCVCVYVCNWAPIIHQTTLLGFGESDIIYVKFLVYNLPVPPSASTSSSMKRTVLPTQKDYSNELISVSAWKSG